MKRLKRVQVIPTFVSLANLLFGMASIIYSTRVAALGLDTPNGMHALYVAAMCVCFAMVADLLDGRIARMTGGDSAFGAEIDSLSDVVSFGVAPAVMVKVMMDQAGHLQKTTWVLGAAYVAFAAMRLARYNVEKDAEPSERFSGLPTPGAAGAVVSLVLLYAEVLIQPEKFGWLASAASLEVAARAVRLALPVYMLVVGVLMVTRVRYTHLGKVVLSGRKPFPHLVILALVVVFAALQLELTLAAGFTLYVAAGLVLELVALVSGKTVGEPAADGRRGGLAEETGDPSGR